jgi:hypothetical protein
VPFAAGEHVGVRALLSAVFQSAAQVVIFERIFWREEEHEKDKLSR